MLMLEKSDKLVTPKLKHVIFQIKGWSPNYG